MRSRGSHNSYVKQESLIDQLVYHRMRHLELDIHADPLYAPTGDWNVYHGSLGDHSIQ